MAVSLILATTRNYIGQSDFDIEYNEGEFVESFQQALNESTLKRASQEFDEELRNGYQQNEGDYNLSELEDSYYQDNTFEDLDLVHTHLPGFKLDEINPGSDNVNDLENCKSEIPRSRAGLSPQSLSTNPSNLPSIKKKRIENPLLNFIDNPNSSMKKSKKSEIKINSRKCPKKEYYRIKLIRTWKKNLRKIIKSEENNQIIFPIYDPFYLHYFENKARLVSIANTKNGPQAKAKNKKISKSDSQEAKSFNNKFVAGMFMDQACLESFRLYVISEFKGKDCEELSNRFDFMCCKNNKHGKVCQDLWNKLMKFSLNSLLFCNNQFERNVENFN